LTNYPAQTESKSWPILLRCMRPAW